MINASFWGATEDAFYTHLQQLIRTLAGGKPYAELPARESWLAVLRRQAVDLFDTAFVGSGAVERQKPRRVAQAYQQLNRNLHGPKLRLTLGVAQPQDDKPKKLKKTLAEKV